jgi:hypoxanthine phosphoribosyltransferase
MSAARIEPLYSAETVQERVRALARRLQGDIGGEDPLVVALLGGSVIFLADLLRGLSSPLRFEFIHVEYGQPQSDEDMLDIHYPVPLAVAGESLLLVKDVVSTGVIESYLASQLRERGARAVRFAAVIDLPAERKTGFTLDYGVFTAERQGAFVGYGLKHEGRYGGLPYIGRWNPAGGDAVVASVEV